ncbi:S-layer homology domain-containing protein [Salibacterium aidingense]|uniref:S-layer homology domain-containing protein n=1 Tax=Salibacterium aidingense TaxID=384933 RepID=UPI0003F51ED4|nr:S-layer homology domain-containing protein [Salibacterium aidingense]
MKKIAGVALLSGLLIAPSAVSAVEFPDVPPDFWAYDSIDKLSDRGTMSGFPDGRFGPNEPVKRIQAASMIKKELGLERQDDEVRDFNDIPDDFPQMDVIDVMDETGILRGSDGNFRPYEPLTRAQMASVMTRALDLEDNENFFFTDIQPDYWNYGDISALAHSGITGGKDDGTFAPSEATTRAQFVTFLHRSTDEDSDREPIDPMAGDYGKYVVKDDLLYGVSDPSTLSAYQKNENGEYEEVESYAIEDTEVYKESSEEERKLINFDMDSNLRVGLGSGNIAVPITTEEGTDGYTLKNGEIIGTRSSMNLNYVIVEDGYTHFYFIENGVLKDEVHSPGDYNYEVKEIIEVSSDQLHFAGSKIFFRDGNSIVAFDMLSKEEETVYTGKIDKMTILEDKLVVTRQDGMTVMDLEGDVIREEEDEWLQGTFFLETANGLEVKLADNGGMVEYIER